MCRYNVCIFYIHTQNIQYIFYYIFMKNNIFHSINVCTTHTLISISLFCTYPLVVPTGKQTLHISLCVVCLLFSYMAGWFCVIYIHEHFFFFGLKLQNIQKCRVTFHNLEYGSNMEFLVTHKSIIKL